MTEVGPGDPPPDNEDDAGTDVDAGPDAGEIAPPGCAPTEETCNGRDDDCDGLVDEVPPEPCEGGGVSLCVAGRMSEALDQIYHTVREVFALASNLGLGTHLAADRMAEARLAAVQSRGGGGAEA